MFANDFPPGPAFVVKPLARAIKAENYSLTVIAIEAAIVEVVTKLRRAGNGQLTLFKTALGFARKFHGRGLGGVAVNQKRLRPQRRTWKGVEKDLRARDTIKLVRAIEQMNQPFIVAGTP